MHNGQEFSNLIYEYFVMRIRFQYYQCGDPLPTIETLCREFNVSSLTVKAALKRLRSEGYISMRSGQVTTVIFNQDTQALAERINGFIGSRWHAFADLYQSAEQIFIPLFTRALCQMTNDEFNHLHRLSQQPDADDLMRFYTFCLQKLDNPLMMNLLWETSIFQGFPFVRSHGTSELYDMELTHDSLEAIIAAGRSGDWSAVHDSFLTFQRVTVQKQLQYFGRNIPPFPDGQQEIFVWHIYRERPQVCYDLAIQILHRNFIGDFSKTHFLPSYEKMAGSWGVSVSTMRRTIAVLGQLGAADTINGKGTFIYPLTEPGREPDLSQPAIRRNLAYFMQALEIICFTMAAVLPGVLSAAAPEDRQRLTGQLQKHCTDGQDDLVLWQLLLFVVHNSPQHGVREIYRKLYGLFLWGYPIRQALLAHEHDGRRCRALARAVVEAFKADEDARCVAAVGELTASEFAAAGDILLEHGLTPGKLRQNPSIHLLLDE